MGSYQPPGPPNSVSLVTCTSSLPWCTTLTPRPHQVAGCRQPWQPGTPRGTGTSRCESLRCWDIFCLCWIQARVPSLAGLLCAYGGELLPHGQCGPRLEGKVLFSPQEFRGQERPALHRAQDCLPEMERTVCYLPNPESPISELRTKETLKLHISFSPVVGDRLSLIRDQ